MSCTCPVILGRLDCSAEYWKDRRAEATTQDAFYEANCAILELFDAGCRKFEMREKDTTQAGE